LGASSIAGAVRARAFAQPLRAASEYRSAARRDHQPKWTPTSSIPSSRPQRIAFV
jgi:hypothetical protein